MANQKILTVEFKADSRNLEIALKKLQQDFDKLQKSINSTAASQNKINASQKRNANSVNQTTKKIQQQNQQIKLWGKNTTSYLNKTKVVLGAQRKLQIELKKTTKGMFDLNSSQRLLDGSFATFRSKLLLASFALGLVIRPLLDLAKASGKVDEIISKANVVFGENATAVRRWADLLSQSVGRVSSDLLSMAATLQDTFVPLGFSRDAATSFSTSMTKLALDVASFNDKADADVIRDFQSALVGNHETVLKYGIKINVATLEQEAFNMGLTKSITQLNESQKVLARMSLIQQGSADAIGDLSRTQDSYNNTLKEFAAFWTDIKHRVGDALKPIIMFGMRIASDQAVLNTLGKALGLIAAYFVSIKIQAKLAAIAMIGFKRSLAKTGVGVLVVGLGYLAERFMMAGDEVKDFNDELDEIEAQFKAAEESASGMAGALEEVESTLSEGHRGLEKRLMLLQMNDEYTKFFVENNRLATEAEAHLIEEIINHTKALEGLSSAEKVLEKFGKSRVQAMKQQIFELQNLRMTDLFFEAGGGEDLSKTKGFKAMSEDAIFAWQNIFGQKMITQQTIPTVHLGVEEDSDQFETIYSSFVDGFEESLSKAGINPLELIEMDDEVLDRFIRTTFDPISKAGEKTWDHIDIGQRDAIISAFEYVKALKSVEVVEADIRETHDAKQQKSFFDLELTKIGLAIAEGKDYKSLISELDLDIPTFNKFDFIPGLDDLAGDDASQVKMGSLEEKRLKVQLKLRRLQSLQFTDAKKQMELNGAINNLKREEIDLNEQIKQQTVENSFEIINSVMQIADAYANLQQIQLDQSKQKALSDVEDIRNERIRLKRIDKINQEYDKKQKKLNKETKRNKRAQTVINTSAAIMEVLSDESIPSTFAKWAMVSLVGAQGLMQLATIDATKYQYGGAVGGRRHSQGGTMIEAERGEYVMSRDAVESIGVGNLDAMNKGRGGGVTVHISGNVMTEDFVENDLAEKIREAVRKGVDFGIDLEDHRHFWGGLGKGKAI